LDTIDRHHGLLCQPPKLTKPTEAPRRERFDGFVSDQSSRFGGAFGRALVALESGCPGHVPIARWQQAVEDGRAFLAKWGGQAEALGWSARDLFGLHQPPAKPHPSYSRLSRYDETGLVWLLDGRKVLALTAEMRLFTIHPASPPIAGHKPAPSSRQSPLGGRQPHYGMPSDHRLVYRG